MLENACVRPPNKNETAAAETSNPFARAVGEKGRTRKCKPFANIFQKCKPFPKPRPQREPFRSFGQPVPKSGNPFQLFAKIANPFNDFHECSRPCQNLEPFCLNLHREWSPTRSTKKLHFYVHFMKAECNKNGGLIFVVFAWCHLCPKTANPSRPAR